MADREGRGQVIVPGDTFADYILFICSIIGRYAGINLTVLLALVRLLRSCASVLPEGSERHRILAEAAQRVLDDGEREIARPADRESLRAAVTGFQARLR